MQLRENKIDIQGRSLLLNVLAIILNISGVFFVAKGFHISAGDSGITLKIIGFFLLLGGLFGAVALKGMYMFSYVARAFVGGLFIVSGLVKANDPWGFAFKLEEYFSPMGLAYDFPFFESFSPWVLEISILVCIAEIVLGVAVIVGGKIKLTSWLLVLMMVFFTWLTYYTFSCVETNELLRDGGMLTERDCVTDCGCFGDALKGSVGRSLTPYESFWKDIVLFYFVIIIFFNQRKIEMNTYRENWVMGLAALSVVIFFSWVFGWYFPVIFYMLTLLGAHIVGNMNLGNLKKPWKMAMFVSAVSLLFSLYTANYLPVKDYRAYAIGNNIKNEMGKGKAEVVDYKLIYKNKNTGTEKVFDVGEFEEYGKSEIWEYVDRRGTIIEAGVDAPISDFVLETNYANLSDEEKGNQLLDSLILEEFENYYESKLIVKSKHGIDTISAYDYVPYSVDTLGNGDTSFFYKQGRFYGLLDPSTSYSVNVTQYILSLENVILVTIRDIETYNLGAIDDLLSIYNQSKEKGIPFYILTPSSEKQIAEFRRESKLLAPCLAIDGTEVKIIVRSNPGLLLLKKGTIIEKWGSRSIPSFSNLSEKI